VQEVKSCPRESSYREAKNGQREITGRKGNTRQKKKHPAEIPGSQEERGVSLKDPHV